MKSILIILLICLFFYKFKNKISKFTNRISIVNKLYNGKEWGEYRLGDVYYLPPHVLQKGNEDNIMYHKKKFKGSIANELINSNNNLVPKNTKLLLKIINKRAKDKSNYPDTLFLHIRIGDVLCRFDVEWINRINGPMYYCKKGDTVWWDSIINYIKTNNISKVVIIAGTHTNDCLEESANYIIDRTQFLLNDFPTLNITYRLGQSPDEDILTCVYVTHFISTGGGFGTLIKEIKQQIK